MDAGKRRCDFRLDKQGRFFGCSKDGGKKIGKGETFFAVKRKAVPGRAMEGNFPQRAGKKI